VDEVAVQLQQYEESLSSSLVSAMEKLVQRLKKSMSYPSPIWASVSAVRSKCFSAQEHAEATQLLVDSVLVRSFTLLSQ